jgi:hypothetical protein
VVGDFVISFLSAKLWQRRPFGEFNKGRNMEKSDKGEVSPFYYSKKLVQINHFSPTFGIKNLEQPFKVCTFDYKLAELEAWHGSSCGSRKG